MDSNWFKELFINEAKAAKDSKNVGGSSEPDLQAKTVHPTTSDQVITADTEYDGLSSVTVEAMKLSKANCDLQFRPDTPNYLGIMVDTPLGYDGLSDVMINWDPAFIPENIADGVEIFGVTGTLKAGGGSSELKQQIEELEATVTELEAWKADNEFAAKFFADRSKSSNAVYMFSDCTSITEVPLFDTSNVTDMTRMFNRCTALTKVPLFNTSNVTNTTAMFNECASLTSVPPFDTGAATSMQIMFIYCTSLVEVPLFNTSNATNMSNMFTSCSSLKTIPQLDIRSCTNLSGIITGARLIENCYFRNIKTNLQIGSSTSYGHLLTVDSLLHLIKELRDTGSIKTLTMGNINLEKIANTYVKLIPITDEMRAEDDLIDEKYPFEVCESTDEGAMTINDYVAGKNWQLV